jgi:hypothetical protein
MPGGTSGAMSGQPFECGPCGYTTDDKKDWRKHLTTKKHLSITAAGGARESCPDCGKTYKYASGVSRHRKTCEPRNASAPLSQIRTMLQELVRETKEASPVTHVTNTYNTTNRMTINLFLNEQCKEAMDLGDFIDSVTVSLEDLRYTCDHGYVKGITRILAQRLRVLGPTERPIHCVDGKRLQFYVKDAGAWERDGDGERIDKSIHDVSHKQIQRIKEWERDHPNWDADERGTTEYLAVVRNVMGGVDPIGVAQRVENIKRELGASTGIRDAIENA